MPNVWTDQRLVSAQEMSRLSAAIAGTYVFPTASGGAVTSNSNMAPTVATINANTGLYVNGTHDTTGFVSTTVTVTTADATNPRRDWIWYDGAGACGVTAGTPAASPVLPDLTAGRIGFYEVYVAANDTSIDSGDLIDRRANGRASPWALAGSNTTEATMTSATAANLVTVTGLSIAATTPVMIIVTYRKSAAAHTPTIGLTINATVVIEAVYAGTGIGTFAATNEAQAGMTVLFLAPRRTNYDRGTTGNYFTGGATAATGAALPGGVQTAAMPIATITDVIIRGDSDGTNTLGVQGVYVYVGL